MEHDEAIRLQAAERYVARELSREEQDAFEGHFFDCPDCAEDVRFELTFAANVRAASRDKAPALAPAPVPAPPAPNFWDKARQRVSLRPAWIFSYGANLALAAGCVFFLVTGRQAIQPHFAHVYFAPGPAHGEEDVHDISGSTVYAVHFPPTPNTGSYFYEILDESGHRESSAVVPYPAGLAAVSPDDVAFEVPVKGLPNGLHRLEVHAGNSDGELASRSKFRLTTR